MVKTVATGVAAVNYVRQQHVDLVLLDMHLEVGLDGLDVYKQILQYKPEQKVIIVSGYAENDRVREALSLGVRRTLRKPYSLNRLGKIIREVLTGDGKQG